jgi:hypothetical protein
VLGDLGNWQAVSQQPLPLLADNWLLSSHPLSRGAFQDLRSLSTDDNSTPVADAADNHTGLL